MSHRIEALELFVRETPPGRMPFVLGRGSSAKAQPLVNPLVHLRLVLRDEDGNETFGSAGDRLSVRWLDKRPGRSTGRKRRELVALIERARELHLANAEFGSPFDHCLELHRQIMSAARKMDQEDLTGSFASALFERALIDAVARAAGRSVFDMLFEERLGFDPSVVHPELSEVRPVEYLPPRPQWRFYIRHTVGLADPLVADDVQPENRIGDGLPETLEEYVRADGLRYFKVKVSGNAEADVRRLARIWDVLPKTPETAITLDANEAYGDLATLERLVDRLEREHVGLFQHILYIEQPLPRKATFDETSMAAVRRLAERKPLIIDEADGTLDAFRRAAAIGYRGTSHKNCKGFFKSLVNKALVHHRAEQGPSLVLSGEDLQNLPIVPLHQDFAACAILGLTHCERNGHHYNYGLALLSEKDRQSVARHHRDLYVRRHDEWFLRIVDGQVRCPSLACPGFGVRDEPDWQSMQPLRSWLEMRHPPGEV